MTKKARLFIKLRTLFIPDGPYGDRKRGKLYEPYLKQYGKNFKLGSQSFIFNPNGLSVGNNVYIGFNSYIGQGEAFLEDEVLIGNFVSITPSNHLMKADSFRFGGYEARPIRIGKGTWIGAQSAILAGVTIGSSCLIASGAIVTKSFGNGLIIGGIPAKEINKIETFKEKYELK